MSLTKTQTPSEKQTTPQPGFQEEAQNFYQRIIGFFNNKTESEIDFHKLSKYEVEIILPMVFYYIAELVEEKKELVTYRIIVGQGNHSEQGPQLPGKVTTLCKSYFAIKADLDEVNAGVLVVKVSLEKAAMIMAMKRIKDDIDMLQTFRGVKKRQNKLNNGGLHSFYLASLSGHLTKKELERLREENVKVKRLLNGFSNNGFYPIVLKCWSSNLTKDDIDEIDKIILEVWAYIINLASEKFLLTQEGSLLSDSTLLDDLDELYQKKPKSLQDLFPDKFKPGRKLYIIYTFTEDESEIDFNDFCSEQDRNESFSPSKDNLKDLLQTNTNLILRFTENTEIADPPVPPVYKKLQNVKRFIDGHPNYDKVILLIIHLSKDSDLDSNFLPFDSNWEQYMIDSLMG